MKRFLLVAIVAGFAGCVHGQFVMAPDGQPAQVVTCHHQHKCYIKAQRLCPFGYQVLDEPYGSLLFRCGPYPPPPSVAPAPDPNAPAAPMTPAPQQEQLYRT